VPASAAGPDAPVAEGAWQIRRHLTAAEAAGDLKLVNLQPVLSRKPGFSSIDLNFHLEPLRIIAGSGGRWKAAEVEAVRRIALSQFLLTDTPARAARLARSLDALGPSRVIDLLDPAEVGLAPERSTVRAFISDIASLKLHLDRLASRRTPYVCLLREDTSRARAQAMALGAAGILPPGRASPPARRGRLAAPARAGGARDRAGGGRRGRRMLTRIFELARGGSVVPEVVSAGAALIEGP
jgi:hypothetical protein